MNQRTHVAIGVIYNVTKDKILISKRSNNQYLAGYWEFPGGKVEYNEDVITALKRELFEELGVIIKKAVKYTSINHNYKDKKVLLDVFKVTDWSGLPKSKEKQEFCWVSINELNNYKFPDANKYIIQSISLAPLYVISKESYEDYLQLYSIVEKLFVAGLKNFQLRLKTETDKSKQKIVKRLSVLADRYDAKLILNSVATDIKQYSIDGIHLNTNELMKHSNRPISQEYILGASCHNEEQLIKAAEINVNYAFLSPVQFTASHPEAIAMGWDKFSDIISEINFPIYALGGMKPSDLKIANVYGAYGIAMLGAVWNTDALGKNINFCVV
ncbi:MAG: DNA mismatch repair protein MutT [Legionellales bacterium]|nr:DNA mismatch repair protein MutT [Legionellales bacterium]|tara:strand:+ start:1095 stop:2078 length:984 start_codon:yes stop_codon:yes gene_type:complete